MRAITYLAPILGSVLSVYSLPPNTAAPTKIVPRVPSTEADPLPDLPTLSSAAQCLEVLPQGGVVGHSKTGPCTYPTATQSFDGPQIWTEGIWLAQQEDGTSVDVGQHTFEPTTAAPSTGSEPQPSSGVTGNGDSCPVKMVKITLNGHAVWTNDPDSNRGAMCEDYCKPLYDPNKISSFTCIKIGDEYYDDKGNKMSDDLPDGTRVSGLGTCVCNDPLLETVVEEIVTKALPAVGEITCKTWYTAIDAVVKIGLSAIPGLGAMQSTLVGFAAQAAEAIAWAIDDAAKQKERYQQFLDDPDNAEAADATSHNLMDSVCGNKYTPPDAEKVFNAFQFAADFASAPRLFASAAKSWPPPFARGKGTPEELQDYLNGLKPRGKSGPEPTAGKPTDAGPAPTQTKPKPTLEPSEKATTTRNHCTRGNARRGTGGSDNDKGCDDDIHLYSVEKWEVGSTTTPAVTCDPRATQACAHYYSAMKQAGRSSVFTCKSKMAVDNRGKAKAVDRWNADHTDKMWRSYTSAEYFNPFANNGKGGVTEPECEIDEWPPNYFLEQMQLDAGTTDAKGQLVRWLPHSPNNRAGKQWASFCKNNDGDDGNAQRTPKPNAKQVKEDDEVEIKTRPFNKDVVELIGEFRTEVSPKKNGIQTTTTIWSSAKFTRAVFSLQFDFGGKTPSKENDWLLKENPCWPQDIAYDDPGYVLAVDDPWYADNEAAANLRGPTDDPVYKKEPSEAILAAAQDRHSRLKRPASPGSDTRRSLVSRSENEILEIVEGKLMARDEVLNTTRLLTERELQEEVEIRRCADRMCTKERTELVEEDEDPAALVLVPGYHPPSLPIENGAVPTETTTQFLPRGRRAALSRTPVSVGMPELTASPEDI